MRLGTTAEWKDWLWRGRFLWGTVFLLAVGVAWLALRCPRNENTVRQLGLFYQVVGVGAAGWQLHRTAKEHGVDSLWAKTVKYLRQVPFRRGRDNTVILAGVGAAVAAGNGAGMGWGTNPTDTTERKVEWLLEIARNHENRIIAVDLRVDQAEKNLLSAIEQEIAQREAALAALDTRFKTTAIGPLDLALFGLFYILLGTLLSTATPEICKWLLPGCRLGV